jgi:hypothetical protein
MNVIDKEMIEFANEAKIWFEEATKSRTYTRKEISKSHMEGDYLAIRWGVHDRAICVCKLDIGFDPVIMGDWISEKEATL